MEATKATLCKVFLFRLLFAVFTGCSSSEETALPVEPPGTDLPALRVEGRRIVDDQDRIVLLRGVNVNQLGDYFQARSDIPTVFPLTRTDVEQIAALGFNVIRLIVHWSALEPERGVWDEAYLNRVREAVAWARELGVYVVLDMHQDSWGKYINSAPDETCEPPFEPAVGWDGAPEWATFTDGLSGCRLMVRELSPTVMRATESFWDDREGIQQHLVETWAWLARAFRDDTTVAGYDLLNEPHWGERYARTVRERKGTFYWKAIEAIRDAESGRPAKIVFFEPTVLWSGILQEEPQPFTDDKQIVYSPHIYAESITVDVALLGTVLWPLRTGFERADREAQVYGTPLWCGEWGRFWDDGGEYAARYAALEDEFQIGGAWWQWKQSCGDPHGVSWPDGEIHEMAGNLVVARCGDPGEPAGAVIGFEENHARVLSRPYPRRFPGEIEFVSDPAARTLDLSGTVDLPAAPLEVWIPGEGAPTIGTAGLSEDSPSAVPGGWILTATPTAESFDLRAAASVD